MNSLAQRDITYLKGVGPQRASLLARECGIKTIRDLLYYVPTHYVDRTNAYHIRDFQGGEMPYVIVKGRFLTFTEHGEGAKKRLVGLFTDGTATMEVVWFNSLKRIRQTYTAGTQYVVFGKPTPFNGHWSMSHPEIDAEAKLQNDPSGLRGVYTLTQELRKRGITSRTFHTLAMTALNSLHAPMADTLPASLVKAASLMPLGEAMRAVHAPRNAQEAELGRMRLKFDELFYLQLNLRRFARRRAAAVDGLRFPKVGRVFNRFYSEILPFPLTEAQKRVVREIHADMQSGRQMNRLLQGDVGSGKTLVALLAMLIAVGNSYQAAIMAPTEILAGQHFDTLNQWAAPLGVNIKLLTGSTPKAQRDIIHRQLLDGSLHIIVGTHALLEDPVKFARLGLAVIDEQHRFGVAQRARLWQKNPLSPPHVLVMTATPIPRTLAMTVYGDLEVSVIDELPPGRKPISTLLRYDAQRMEVFQAIGRQLALGRQAYIVYPLIDENEKLALQSLEDGFERVATAFPSYKVVCVHGRMKPAEKDAQMALFASGQAQILVATTVIEVGVNVPNASVMMIENAERFGLSQLHQLRGRVGRGADQSYCVLMTKQKIASTTRKRLQLMTETTDGFRIAEADMQMRGPGDIEGTQQSGLPIALKVANLATDGRLVGIAREWVDRVLDTDPEFTSPDGQLMAAQLAELARRQADWSRIS